MKKALSVLATTSCLLSSATYTHAMDFCFKPKFGMDIGQRVLKWDDNMGKDHFAESLPQVDFFVEVPITEELGIRLGHEQTIKKNSSVSYPLWGYVLSGDYQIQAAQLETFSTSTKFTANYIDVVYNHSLFQQDNYKFKISGFIGLTNGKLKLSQKNITQNGSFDDLNTSRKTFLREGISIHNLWNDTIDLHLGITHEHTAKLKTNPSIYDAGTNTWYNYNVKAKNSIIFHVGVTYEF